MADGLNIPIWNRIKKPQIYWEQSFKMLNQFRVEHCAGLSNFLVGLRMGVLCSYAIQPNIALCGKWMFVPIKKGDGWQIIQWDTDAIPWNGLSARHSNF
jgi:hypothetical protein